MTVRPAPGAAPRTDAALPHVSALDVGVERRGEVVVVHLTGELDIYTANQLPAALTRCDPRDTPLVIDLRGVRLIDSCGLGALIVLHNRAATSDRRIALVSDGDSIRGILRIAGMEGSFLHAGDVTSACAAALEFAAEPVP